MKCEDYDKKINSFLDGEIDKHKLKEIEEHLTSCQRCAEKLSQLKNLEAAAKNIKISEPSPAYWQTFARKVSDEIILRKRKPLWSKIKSIWESTFIYSPVKLRIAGGIASILLVFIISKLYWDYRGGELERIRRERMEEALSTKVQEAPKKFEPAVTESLLVEDLKELAPPTPVTPTAEEKVQEEKGKEVQQVILKPQVGFVVSDSVKDSLRVRGGRAGDVTHIVSIPESISKETEKSESVKETTLYLKGPLKLAAEQPIQSAEERTELFQVGDIRYYELDKNQVRKLTEKDTLVEVDTLQKVISSWSEFFDKKPETEWLLEGFSQIKIAYHLLFLKSKDESSLDEGIKLLNKYKESAVEQKTKDELNKHMAELEALRKK